MRKSYLLLITWLKQLMEFLGIKFHALVQHHSFHHTFGKDSNVLPYDIDNVFFSKTVACKWSIKPCGVIFSIKVW